MPIKVGEILDLDGSFSFLFSAFITLNPTTLYIIETLDANFQKKIPTSRVDCTSINQIKTSMYYVHISNQHTTSLGTLFYQGSKACISSRKKDNRNSYGL